MARASAGQRGGVEVTAGVELQPVEGAVHLPGARELTLRAVLTGMVIGGALSLCNIYSGLKIGWGFNMSITATLLAFGFWRASSAIFKTPDFGILENNINQTAASSAAAISSAGLVAPIPALTMITGTVLPWHWLALWSFSVCLVGLSVAVGLRKQMILVDKLPFPSGIATAQTLTEMYSKGAEAMSRVKMLLGAASAAAALKIAGLLLKLPRLPIPGGVKAGSTSASLSQLGFTLDPSLLMVGVGGIIGFRAGASLLFGAVVAWGVIAPRVVEAGWVAAPEGGWYGPLLPWLLWPGVAMMVSSSMTSFAFSWRSILNGLRGTKAVGAAAAGPDDGDVSKKVFLWGLVGALIVSVILQVHLFGIGPFVAAFGVLLTFVLAVVAGRVSGETAITPVGAMGKVTQLIFGVVAPGNAAANLMSANVTGGAASQCADLLHDLKTGHILGARARLQAVAQFGGALSGSLIGAAAYLVLIPDPKNQLLTDEWPAPAAAQWKAVAELFMKGMEAMPQGVLPAMIIAGVLGVVLAILEKKAPAKLRPWIPSPASVGLAFVVPAYNAVSMFLGGLLAVVAGRFFKSWTARFLVVLASGLIAGESITGVGIALQKMLFP